MVEEAKLVVDCPTVVDEPENYGRHCIALDIKLSAAAFHLHHFSCCEQNTELVFFHNGIADGKGGQGECDYDYDIQ